MSLATSPPVFAYYSSNYAATPAASCGTNFTTGANDTDGTAVSCLSALTHDVHRIRIRIQGVTAANVNNNSAGDLLVDPAGGTSWAALINDLVCGGGTSSIVGYSWFYEFPLYIAAGSTIGWQCKTVHTADITTGYVLIECFGEPSHPAQWWCGSGVETVGISDSQGTAITPGDSGANGSWTNVGSTTARHWKAAQLGINSTDASALAVQYHAQIGCGSQPLPGSGIVWAAFTTTETATKNAPGWTPCNIPIGTQMQARATCSGTAENIRVAAYGVY